jgi:hypothetical protein
VVAAATESYLLTAGGGGALYSGGAISGVNGQGGPDLGIYLRKWGLGFFAQAGYGNAGGFGQLTIVKQWNFAE